jgi:hypothetical protein
MPLAIEVTAVAMKSSGVVVQACQLHESCSRRLPLCGVKATWLCRLTLIERLLLVAETYSTQSLRCRVVKFFNLEGVMSRVTCIFYEARSV